MPFVSVPLARTDWQRDYAGGVDLRILNRFFEQDPSSAVDDTALLARPGTDLFRDFGDGPIRGLFAQLGLFNEDLFVASGRSMFRFDGTTETPLTGQLSDSRKPVSMTFQTVGDLERLWIADGENLFYYEGEGKAQGSLTFSGQPVAGDRVQMGSVFYEFVLSEVDLNNPAGTDANPWRVLLGPDVAGSVDNLGGAVSRTGIAGGSYSTNLTANPEIQTRRVEPARLTVEAILPGTAGNSLVTLETGANLAWGSGTLTDGGTNRLVPVPVPEGGNPAERPVSVTSLASYVIISVAGSQRMYFIRPGEFFVEIFAEAETEPDEVVFVATVGTEFWAMGRSTVEPWSPTGDEELPFAPIIGRALRYGSVPGTVQVVDDRIIFVDERGIVRDNGGNRLSNHSVEEALRKRV